MSHTPGPWRWEVNESSKSVHLVGGKPMFDLTIIDFERWGMNSATMRLRDTAIDGMNLMDRCTVWAKKVPGREHHASWFKDIDHPDTRLIAAAPDLLAALQDLLRVASVRIDDPRIAQWDAARAAIAKATGATP